MTEVSISRAQLRRRLMNSILAGTLFFAFAIGTFIYIRFGPQKDRLPVVLRDVQKLNEKVGRLLVSNPGHAPFKAAPPKGKAPRVNGLIGLEDDVDADTYRIVVESGTKMMNLKIEDIVALPRTESTTDFKCVEGWTEVFQYAGVRFSDFMKAEVLDFTRTAPPILMWEWKHLTKNILSRWISNP